VREARLYTSTRSDRARCCANVATNSHVSANGERANRILRIKHDDEVGDVRANLEAPANPAGRDA
jgi:hypothetical protein